MKSAPGRIRRGIVIGALAFGLAGAGGAAVWASATPTSTASPTDSVSAPAKAWGHGFKHGLLRGGLHGEVTVKKSDGTYATIVSQRGTVTEATDTRLTVRSEDGYEHSYTLNAETRIRAAAQKGTALTPGDLAVGDEVVVRGVRSGSEDTAQQVVKGPFPAKAQGQGHGKGHKNRGQTQSPSPSATQS
ncbi:hypothetical protein [Sinomonas mesophila]|uniref:hypothetical protein n=1 Tax=Sinomonas mesophila TaxID=1531955 RepID=UPI0009878716|nr:hypothetical protein [Sinomonas mesophila]